MRYRRPQTRVRSPYIYSRMSRTGHGAAPLQETTAFHETLSLPRLSLTLSTEARLLLLVAVPSVLPPFKSLPRVLRPFHSHFHTPRPAPLLSTRMNLFHRKVQPWEVVEQQSVDAVPMFTDEEREDLDIVGVYDATMSGVYIFELKKVVSLRGAVAFARKTLLQDAAAKGYNIFLSEGWKVTRLRRGKQQRAEVRYWGRPAYANRPAPRRQMAPFLAMLDSRGV